MQSKERGDLKKVLLITASFPPPSAGGSVEYLYNVFSNFPDNTVVVHTGNTATAPEFDKSFPHRIIRDDWVIHVVNGHKASRWQRLKQLILWPLRSFQLIMKEKPDVVAIGEFNVAGAAALASRILFKRPYALFTYAEEIAFLDNRPAYKFLLKRLLRYASAIFTVSEFTRGLLLARGANDSIIHKVLPSIGENKLIRASNEKLNLTKSKYMLENKRVLLTVGRLVERKGHLAVIEALPTVIEAIPNVKYVVSGTGPEDIKLVERTKELALTDYVIFTGCVDDEELSCLYDICDVFVMPHRQMEGSNDTEGCPTVFLEASSHGKPCIGGNAGGVADAIIHLKTGLIIDGTIVSNVANSVISLLSHPEVAKEMGKNGMEYVKNLTPIRNSQTIRSILSI